MTNPIPTKTQKATPAFVRSIDLAHTTLVLRMKPATRPLAMNIAFDFIGFQSIGRCHRLFRLVKRITRAPISSKTTKYPTVKPSHLEVPAIEGSIEAAIVMIKPRTTANVTPNKKWKITLFAFICSSFLGFSIRI
jgi:hypothetical protein